MFRHTRVQRSLVEVVAYDDAQLPFGERSTAIEKSLVRRLRGDLLRALCSVVVGGGGYQRTNTAIVIAHGVVCTSGDRGGGGGDQNTPCSSADPRYCVDVRLSGGGGGIGGRFVCLRKGVRRRGAHDAKLYVLCVLLFVNPQNVARSSLLQITTVTLI